MLSVGHLAPRREHCGSESRAFRRFQKSASQRKGILNSAASSDSQLRRLRIDHLHATYCLGKMRRKKDWCLTRNRHITWCECCRSSRDYYLSLAKYIFLRDGRREWKLVTHKKLKSGRLMPWGKVQSLSELRDLSTFGEIRRPRTITIQPAKRKVASLAMQRRSGAQFSRTSNQIWRNSVVRSNISLG